MSTFLLKLSLHDSSKVRIMESINSLQRRNVFQDVILYCSDGIIQLDKLSLGLIFPFLSDVLPAFGSAETVVLLPESYKADVINSVHALLGITQFTEEFVKTETDQVEPVEIYVEGSDDNELESDTIFSNEEISGTVDEKKEKCINSKTFLTPECPQCGIKLKNRKGLKRHCKTVHEKPLYKCVRCLKTFPTEKTIQKHIRNYHEEKECIFCKKLFKNANTLRSHISKCPIKTETKAVKDDDDQTRKDEEREYSSE